MAKEEEYSKLKGNVVSTVLPMAIIMLVATPLAYYKFPCTLPRMAGVAERLAYTLKLNSLNAGVFMLMIHVIANKRLNSGQINPLSNLHKDKIEVHIRVLNNTVEQFLVSFILQLATTCWLEEHQMKIIAIVVLYFVVGRLVFWRGYLNPDNGHTMRAYGLPLTMFPSAFMFLFCVYKLITQP